jgi:hypothetical protein
MDTRAAMLVKCLAIGSEGHQRRQLPHSHGRPDHPGIVQQPSSPPSFRSGIQVVLAPLLDEQCRHHGADDVER